VAGNSKPDSWSANVCCSAAGHASHAYSYAVALQAGVGLSLYQSVKSARDATWRIVTSDLKILGKGPFLQNLKQILSLDSILYAGAKFQPDRSAVVTSERALICRGRKVNNKGINSLT
jgi:hypothetical protein